MKWDETIASQCRYGDIAERIWGKAEILFEDSEDDYQGHATIAAKMLDGSYSFYEWQYGSCSSCDTWEAAEYDDDRIEKEMRKDAVWFVTLEQFDIFLRNILAENFTGYRAKMRRMHDLLDRETLIKLKKMAQFLLSFDGAQGGSVKGERNQIGH